MSANMEIIGLEKLTKKLLKLPAEATASVKTEILKGAVLVESEAKRSIQRGVKSGRTYRRGGIVHRASAPGEAPATDRGALVRSISHQVFAAGLEILVGTRIKYGSALEFGTSKISPRPWLFPAFKKYQKSIVAAISSALKNIVRK